MSSYGENKQYIGVVQPIHLKTRLVNHRKISTFLKKKNVFYLTKLNFYELINDMYMKSKPFYDFIFLIIDI